MPKATTAKKPAEQPKTTQKEPCSNIGVLKFLGWTDYPNPQHSIRSGPLALTIQQIKDIVGYEEQPEGVDWGEDYLYVNYNSKKVRFNNNQDNRPYTHSHSQAIAQDILMKKWRLNGENAIFGKSGTVQSFQHRAAGALEAELTRVGKDKYKWENSDGVSGPSGVKWDCPVTLETDLRFGNDEDFETVVTIDHTRPKTPADIFYQSAEELGLKGKNITNQVVSELTSILSNSARRLWERLWVKKDAFASIMTNSELFDFVSNHKKLLECVKEIWTTNRGKKLSDGPGTAEDRHSFLTKWCSLGDATALLFLMAARENDVSKYENESPRTQKSLRWGQAFDKAVEFWLCLANWVKPGADKDTRDKSIKDFDPLANAIFGSRVKGQGVLKANEKIGLIIKAFNLWVNGDEITNSNIALSYKDKPNANGVYTLVEFPVLGGIDKGIAPREDKVPAPSPEDIAKAATAIKQEGITQSDQEKGLDEFRKKHPGKLLLFKNKDGSLTAYTRDAGPVSQLLNIPMVKDMSGLFFCNIPLELKAISLKAIQQKGTNLGKIALVDENCETVTDYDPKAKAVA